MRLYERAVKANEERGLCAYWDTLSTDDIEPSQTKTRGSGYVYVNEEGRGDSAHEGSGHASDSLIPIDILFGRNRF